ncbi:type VI secretion system contractile sheath small subunit [Hafnia paralvei]|uniref:type VI secretion system contractile sheath small subunit n=1 Tax=Hafnia paralvei TaxID=546367 RepID=UPI000DF3AE42|nr:type VI secretion system contractile sheath small subunit [Hafnia paralvei]RDA61901.1 type VI secretion system contractile sheath small subunit [Hafnia paralvei]RDA62962.1 type VI secretion system contractile sheath small subunit [Hafnia paralvei]RDA63802.1 type VI secretion system contractile sheath small subunit [Hafnia paralvei]RDA75088.1 type VI secretion system contractile sheath small subunit [Hafnia paralvei]RDA75492.1 type VI secretion system contractile sheath small subunit [Hafnia
MNNTQHKLDKIRPPRVQITYDIEEGNAQIAKELPLVVGVIGDFFNDSQSIQERKFIRIDKDNFNEIMSSLKPNAQFMVDSALPEQEGKLSVSITFKNIDDFLPDNIIQQVEPLRRLLELRTQLNDLRSRAASNEHLKDKLTKIVNQQNSLQGIGENNDDEEEQ